MQNVFAGARHVELVVPSDTVDQPKHEDIRANADGVIILRTYGSDTDVTYNVVTGEKLNVIAQYIRSTGTTAECHLMRWSNV